MTRRRLVLPQQSVTSDRITLSGRHHHYLSHVLRLRPGQQLELLDADGRLCQVRILHIDTQRLELQVLERSAPSPRPTPQIGLLFAHSRRAKTELVLQKATELGVDWLVPARCQRSVSRAPDSADRRRRWQEIVTQAARQCGRQSLPTLEPPQPFGEAAERVSAAADVALVAHPAGTALSQLAPRLTAPAVRMVALAVGPEGGFTEQEMAHATTAGMRPTHLGPLVLRTETAALSAVTLLGYVCGRLEAEPTADTVR